MHPSANELKAFLKGDLSAQDAVVIEQHLDACEICSTSIDAIDISDDPLIGLLRDAGAASVSQESLASAVKTWRSFGEQRFPESRCLAEHGLPKKFGRYEIKTRLGSGGMGVVYEVYDPTLHRHVALKIIASDRVTRSEDRRRFRREAEAAARLQHANIVQVFEFGENDHTLYCTFELVEGGNLRDCLDTSEYAITEAAQIVVTLADAVEYAHVRNVVHRDLKPANILLTEDGTPKIADFGLAKRLDDDVTRTIDGTLLGSPCYMAPEQARGEISSIGPATDIYALGVILYETIVGNPPFQAEDMLAILEQVKFADPVSPSRLRDGVDRDIETVCMKCLEKSPSKRYARAADLAADLRRYIDGLPVSARRTGWPERLAKAAKRHPVVALMTGLIASVVFVFAIVVSLYNQSLLELNEDVRQQLLDAKRKNFALQLQRATVTAGENPQQALQLLRDTEACPVELRDFYWRYLSRFCDRERGVWQSSGEIRAIATTPDLVHFVTGDASGLIQLWAFNRLEPVRTIRGHASQINDITFSADGRSFASVSDDGTTKIWHLDTDVAVLTMARGESRANGVAYSPDQTTLATAHSDGVVRIWNLANGELAKELMGHDDSVFRVSFDVEGNYLASGSRDESIKIWSTKDWSVSTCITEHRGYVTDVQFHPCNPRVLATAHSLGLVQIWAIDSEGHQALSHSIEGFGTTVSSIAFSPDGVFLACGSYDGSTRVARSDSGELICVLDRSNTSVMSIDFFADGTMLTGSKEGRISHWNVDANPKCLTIDAHTRSVTGLVFSANARTIASSSNDGFVRQWSTTEGRQLAEWQSESPWITGVNGTVDRTRFAWEADGVAYLSTFDIQDLSKPSRLSVDLFFPTVVLPLSSALVVNDEAGLRVVEYANGQERWSWAENIVSCLAISDDGDELAVIGDDRLWLGSPMNKSLVPLCRSTPNPTCVRFSADRTLIAVGSEDGKVFVHDTKSGNEILVIPAHAGSTNCLAFSRDGKTLATGGSDRTVKLWDSAAGLDRGLLSTGGTVRTLEFSLDSNMLAAATDDGIIHIWSGN